MPDKVRNRDLAPSGRGWTEQGLSGRLGALGALTAGATATVA